MDYADQLQDDRWIELANAKKAEQNCRCQRCSTQSAVMHVHHIRYYRGRMAWEYKLSQLWCLCDACHGLVHLLQAELPTLFDNPADYVNALKRAGNPKRQEGDRLLDKPEDEVEFLVSFRQLQHRNAERDRTRPGVESCSG